MTRLVIDLHYTITESGPTYAEASPDHTVILDLIDGKEKQADG